jgi:HEAT repeat protein
LVLSRPLSLKSDESFLSKLAVGAIGTRKVLDDLTSQGHEPIELEKGSTSFKVWTAIKTKRLRVPDVLCVRCGTKVETRSKTRLEISMSHSESDPERVWDYGLGDSDFVAIVLCKQVGKGPVDWRANDLVQYVSVSELRKAMRNGYAELTERKGAQEGFEMRYIWPTKISSRPGVIVSVDKGSIRYRSVAGRLLRVSLSRKKVTLSPLVRPQGQVVEGQILASVVPVVRAVPCSERRTESYYLRLLESSSRADRFAAAKALAYFDTIKTRLELKSVAEDAKEEVQIRLEAAVSLERLETGSGIPFIVELLKDAIASVRLDAIISLAGIRSSRAANLLQGVLFDSGQRPEIRAAAAWGLGELKDKTAAPKLIQAFDETEPRVRIEAARALLNIMRAYTSDKAVLRRVLDEFLVDKPDRRAGIAWAIGRIPTLSPQDLLDCLVDENARRWIAYVIGRQDPGRQVAGIEDLKLKDPEVYFAATVLWNLFTSWVAELEEY